MSIVLFVGKATPGSKGPKGEPGDRGPEGLEGLGGLQGVPGTKGNQGAAGGRGSKGDDGVQGETGPVGEPGADGDQGEEEDTSVKIPSTKDNAILNAVNYLWMQISVWYQLEQTHVTKLTFRTSNAKSHSGKEFPLLWEMYI